MRAVTLCLCLFVLAIPALGAQETAQAPPTITHWVQAPAAFPKGAWIAAVTGDPTKAGTFTVKLAMPPGYQIPPHF
ncbi:MAG TPA: hypothetical protein VM736_04970, partial [Gemmatimonadales bacterium]|nr:hypothetical protein [Gemmatimonadales bacterium]